MGDSSDDDIVPGVSFFGPCCGRTIARDTLWDAVGGEALVREGHAVGDQIRCPCCGALVNMEAITDAATGESLTRLKRTAQAAPSSPEMASMLSEVMLRTPPPPWLMPRGGCDNQTHEALEAHGLVVDPAAAPAELAYKCASEALTALDSVLACADECESRARFGEIRAPRHRHDLLLELTPGLLALLAPVLSDASPIGSALAGALGASASLCELSCIISEDGASAQPVHCDTLADARAHVVGKEGHVVVSGCGPADGGEQLTSAAAPTACRLMTIFVALQDVATSMGPTCVWPATHTPGFHAAVAERGPSVLARRPHVALDLPAGGALLMDSRLWHCGGPNASGRRRALLVATFAAAGCYPEGSTYSLLAHLAG